MSSLSHPLHRRPRHRAPRGTRLRARLHPGPLDRALSRGADPTDSPALAVRAQILVSRRARGSIAAGIDRVLVAAAERPDTFSPRAPLRRAAVLAAAPELVELAGRLRDDDPVSPHGVALAQRLLVDGTGPLYTAGSVTLAASEATEAL